MLLEIEDETRDFVTIYKKDFKPKKTQKLKECRLRPEYRPPLNILNGAYEQYLNTRQKNVLLPEHERREDPEEFLCTIHNRYPWLKKILPKSAPDEELIERKNKEVTKSVYQLEYCGSELPRKKKSVVLPAKWIIGETIQRKSYRNPKILASENFLRVNRFKKPSDNLVPDPKQREILRIRTGDTEYNSIIDTTANKVLGDSVLGKPLPVIFRSDAEPLESPNTSGYLVLPSQIF